MALFKPFRGNRASLDAQPLHDGYAYFCTDDGSFHIDYVDADGNLQRKQVNASYLEKLDSIDVDNLVTLDSKQQTIAGQKTFSNGIYLGAHNAYIADENEGYLTILHPEEVYLTAGENETSLSVNNLGVSISTPDGATVSIGDIFESDVQANFYNGIATDSIYSGTTINITADNSINFNGKVDFSNATVTGLSTPNITIATFKIAEANTTINLQNLTYLTSIDWGDGVVDINLSHTYSEIGEYECKIYGVTSINYRAFKDCSSLISVVISNSVTSIGDSAFSGCSGLTSVVIGNSVTSIRNSAFYNCSSLTSIEIPNSVTSIDSYAFRDCSSLTSIVIGNSVASIGDYAFDSCRSLTEVNYLGTIDKWAKIEFGTDISNPLFYAKQLKINGEVVTEVNLTTTTFISDAAFWYCDNLTSVVIGDSVTSIGSYAFLGCSSLTSVVIGDSVTSIGEAAFRDCSSLTSVVIGDSVTSIGYRAFYDCDSLTEITFNNPTPITYNFTTGPTIVVPKDSIDTYKLEWANVASYITSETPATQEWAESHFVTCNSKQIVDGEKVFIGTVDFTNAIVTGLQPTQISITYSELKQLRDNKQLIPGMFYRITDYVCTTTQEGTRAMSNQFDIIVRALSESTLSENASADCHGGNQKINITWEHTLVAGRYDSDSDSFVSLGYEANNEGETVPVIYLEQHADMDESDKCFYVDAHEFDGVTYDRWRLIEAGTADDNYTWDNDAKKFILTEVVVENNLFTVSDVSEIGAVYTMYDDSNTSYLGTGNHNDTFVAAEYKENSEGVVVPVLYKTDLDSFTEVDYGDTIYYVGRYEYKGETYDRWLKVEDDTQDDSTRYYILTNIVVENNQFMKGVIEEEASFVSENIFAWELKYCLDNDKTRFAWADEENGKGVIYYMKDEWGNECPYDFKNIQFERPIDWQEEHSDFIEGLGLAVGDVTWFYTFSWVNENFKVEDLTLRQDLTSDEGDVYGTKYNKIANHYIDDYVSITSKLLNNIIFINSYLFEDGCFYGCYNNKFDLNCFNNTFGNSCSRNTFNNNCYENILGNRCNQNTFGQNCYMNTLKNNSVGNMFGNNCYGNILGDWCQANIFGESCSGNIFENDCFYNELGMASNDNIFGEQCSFNILGNDCSNNMFGSFCDYNTFGIHCSNIKFKNPHNNTITNFCQYINIGSSCYSIYLFSYEQGDSSNYIQNVTLSNGINGDASMSAHYLRVDRNAAPVIYEANNTKHIILD